MRKTKIVCTLGPATDKEGVLREMMLSGMNVARFNFSHGTHSEHKVRLDAVKALREELDLPVAAMLDTKGPEVRLRNFKNGSVEMTAGQDFTLTTEDVEGDETRCAITYPQLPQDVSAGDTSLLDDGLVRLTVLETTAKTIRCRVENSGVMKNHKGVNVPGVSLSMPYMSQQDKDDILFGVEQGFDFIAASFVRCAADVREIRRVLNAAHSRIRIIAKIENQEGVSNLREILAEADGVMVARGDMGVEVDFEKLPGIQKKFIKECCRAGKPVITATQMLESMTSSPAPTRAEITDVANAVFDGTSAVMLSGESAAGMYPVETVRTMSKIVYQAELDAEEVNQYKFLEVESDERDVSNAIGHAACTTARDIKASAIIAVTTSGYTAEMMSKYKPTEPIIAATPVEKTYHQQALTRGVYPVLTELSNDWNALMEQAAGEAERMGFVSRGDSVVFSAGMPLQVSGTTNLIKVGTVE